MYNQYTDKYTKNACSLVTLLHIMLYMYGIRVEPNFIMKVAIFFDKLNLRSPDSGAVFDVIYKGFVYYMNKKLGLNFKVVTNKITNLHPQDTNAYGLGIKGYSSYKYREIKKDGVINEDDIKYLKQFSGGIGHNVMYSARGYFVDTDGSPAYEFSIPMLKRFQEEGLFWNNLRTIIPADEFTQKVSHFTIRLFEAEKRGRLDEYIETNKDNKYLNKAIKLYMYGR